MYINFIQMGRLTPVMQQLCIVHGLQLAVVRVLYPAIATVADSKTLLNEENDKDE